MTYLMGSFVRRRISVSNSLAALADAKLSITATPSSPITKPPFAAATPFAAGLSIAAHTFAPTCFSVKAGTAVVCACPMPGIQSGSAAGIQSRAHAVATAKRVRTVVRMISFGHRRRNFGPDFRSRQTAAAVAHCRRAQPRRRLRAEMAPQERDHLL